MEKKPKDAWFKINGNVWFLPDIHRLIYETSNGERKVIHLNTPASRCFMLLINNENSVISREEFFEHVWKSNGSIVSQNTYYQNISILRRCLRDAGIADIIVTVQKKGLTLNKNINIKKYYYDNIHEIINSHNHDAPTTFIKGEGYSIATYPIQPKLTKNKRFIRELFYLTNNYNNKKIGIITIISLLLLLIVTLIYR